MYATIPSKPFLAWFLFGKPYWWHQWHGNGTLQLYIKAKFYENNHDKIRNTSPWTWAILLASELKYPLEFRPVMERNTKTSQTGLYTGGHYKSQAIARLAVRFCEYKLKNQRAPLLMSSHEALLDIFGIRMGVLLLPSPPSLRALMWMSRSSSDGNWSSTDVLLVSTTLLPLCQFWRYTTCAGESGSVKCS